MIPFVHEIAEQIQAAITKEGWGDTILGQVKIVPTGPNDPTPRAVFTMRFGWGGPALTIEVRNVDQ